MDTLFKIAGQFDIGNFDSVSRLAGGITNDTYLVRAGHKKYVLQKLHKIFQPELLKDTQVITGHLHANGFVTPRLVKTKDDGLGIVFKGGCWRMLTHIPGRCFDEHLKPRQAYSAARLVGTFHRLLDGLDHRFSFRIPGFHDTHAKIGKLKATLKEFNGNKKFEFLRAPAGIVLAGYELVAGRLNGLPERIIHGDPKINNIRFDRSGNNAVSLLDLDTVGYHKLAVELGDACRSWCNGAREGDYKKARFDLNIFRSILTGYKKGAGRSVTNEELRSVPLGVETIILELASRFITDTHRQEYFKLEPGRYSNLFEQNKARALSQVNLYLDFAAKKEKVLSITKEICSA